MGLIIVKIKTKAILVAAKAALHRHTWQATLRDGQQTGLSNLSSIVEQVAMGVARVIKLCSMQQDVLLDSVAVAESQRRQFPVMYMPSF